MKASFIVDIEYEQKCRPKLEISLFFNFFQRFPKEQVTQEELIQREELLQQRTVQFCVDEKMDSPKNWTSKSLRFFLKKK